MLFPMPSAPVSRGPFPYYCTWTMADASVALGVVSTRLLASKSYFNQSDQGERKTILTAVALLAADGTQLLLGMAHPCPPKSL